MAHDGNGNVRALVKADSANPQASAVVERYSYDGFGRELAGANLTPTTSNLNTFKFSTKQLDAETGMNYYGYRFYAADAGRWINRDPIGEVGGINIYTFGENDAVDHVDVFGFASMAVSQGAFAGAEVTKGVFTGAELSGVINPVIIRGGVTTVAVGAAFGTGYCIGTRFDEMTGLSDDIAGALSDALSRWRYRNRCSREKLRRLQQGVDEACKTNGRRCKDAKTPAEVENMIRRNIECINRRSQINAQCYGGGDKGHNKAIDEALNALKNCNLKRDKMREEKVRDCPL